MTQKEYDKKRSVNYIEERVLMYLKEHPNALSEDIENFIVEKNIETLVRNAKATVRRHIYKLRAKGHIIETKTAYNLRLK